MEDSRNCYAVIFTSLLSGEDEAGYAAMSARMEELAAAQEGFLGIESVRGADGLGITVSYWRSEESIRNWKSNAEHLLAQQLGKDKWYRHYNLRIAKVERAYEFTRS
jgi:heme-degrading monooxygenase HmoA